MTGDSRRPGPNRGRRDACRCRPGTRARQISLLTLDELRRSEVSPAPTSTAPSNAATDPAPQRGKTVTIPLALGDGDGYRRPIGDRSDGPILPDHGRRRRTDRRNAHTNCERVMPSHRDQTVRPAHPAAWIQRRARTGDRHAACSQPPRTAMRYHGARGLPQSGLPHRRRRALKRPDADTVPLPTSGSKVNSSAPIAVDIEQADRETKSLRPGSASSG
jgi:hypothetical protein